MKWFFYNILFAIVYVLMIPHFLQRMWKRGGYRQGFLQRIGIYSASIKAELKARAHIWIHAVSVGEVFVALQFIKEFRICRPKTAFVLTTTTSTGHAIAEKQLLQDDVLLYFPADFHLIINHVLNCLRPLALLLVESEIWPNLIRLAKKRNIPVILLNGRISHHSFRGYKKLQPFVRDVMGCFDLLCAQNQDEVGTLVQLGADHARIRVTGSAKYDVTDIVCEEAKKSGETLRKEFFGPDADLLIGGSTWPGEEAALLNIYKNLRTISSKCRLVLVPRHAERANEVAAEIEKSGLSFIRRSEWENTDITPQDQSFDVLLVDTTGELKAFYSIANVIFVGKSLTNHGGQNVIEAAAFAKPIIVGPNMENFSSIMADFLSSQALIQVKDISGLGKTVMALWKDNEKRHAYGQRARQVIRDKAGAIRTSVKLVLPLIESASVSHD